MGRFYSLSFVAATIANASGDYDLFEIDPADDKPVRLHELRLHQTSELGDAAEEVLTIKVVRGHTTTGNGSATTPRPLLHSDTAAGAACETVATTIASTGTGVDLYVGGWNVRIPFEKIWTPDARPTCADTEGLIVVRMTTTVADDITMGGDLIFEEMV